MRVWTKLSHTRGRHALMIEPGGVAYLVSVTDLKLARIFQQEFDKVVGVYEHPGGRKTEVTITAVDILEAIIEHRKNQQDARK